MKKAATKKPAATRAAKVQVKDLQPKKASAVKGGLKILDKKK